MYNMENNGLFERTLSGNQTLNTCFHEMPICKSESDVESLQKMNYGKFKGSKYEYPFSNSR
jgi:hypothetical protein